MGAAQGKAESLLEAARVAVESGAPDCDHVLERAFRAAEHLPLVRAEVQELRVLYWNWSGNVANGAALAGIEAELVAPHSAPLAARLAVDALLGWIHVGDMVRATAVAEEILKELLVDEEEPLHAATRIGLAWALLARGEPEGTAILDELEGRVALLARLSLGVSSYVGVLRAWHGDLATGRSLLLRAQVAARRDDPAVLPFVNGFLADLEFRAGAWGAAEELAIDAEQNARRLGSTNALGIMLALRGRLEAATGRRAEALAHLDEANAISQRAGTHTLSHMIALVHGELALLEGDADAAVGYLRGSHERMVALGVRHPGFTQDHADLVEALARAGLDDEAALELRELERVVEATGCAPAVAGRGRARLVTCSDNEVEELAGPVRRDFHDVASPFEWARTLLVLGARRRRLGQRTESRTDLGEAVTEFERLGATPWADLARVELRLAGGRVGSGQARNRRSVSPLSAQELQVAFEVATGASNREIAGTLYLSVKTVERHLTSIYRKLRLRSRAELLVWLGEHRDLDKALLAGRAGVVIPPATRE